MRIAGNMESLGASTVGRLRQIWRKTHVNLAPPRLGSSINCGLLGRKSVRHEKLCFSDASAVMLFKRESTEKSTVPELMDPSLDDKVPCIPHDASCEYHPQFVQLSHLSPADCGAPNSHYERPRD